MKIKEDKGAKNVLLVLVSHSILKMKFPDFSQTFPDHIQNFSPTVPNHIQNYSVTQFTYNNSMDLPKEATIKVHLKM